MKATQENYRSSKNSTTSLKIGRAFSSLAWVILVVLSSCGPDLGPSFKYHYTIKNQTGMAVMAYCLGCDIVNLAVGETKQIDTNTPFEDYTIDPVDPTTNKFIEFEETEPQTFIIISYSHKVKYRVSGTAPHVDISFINAEGGISTFSHVEPGDNYEFREFAGTQLELSVTVTSTSGDALLYIFHKDKIIKDGRAEGQGTTVKISATID